MYECGYSIEETKEFRSFRILQDTTKLVGLQFREPSGHVGGAYAAIPRE